MSPPTPQAMPTRRRQRLSASPSDAPPPSRLRVSPRAEAVLKYGDRTHYLSWSLHFRQSLLLENDGFSLRAPSIELLATSLLELLKHYHTDPQLSSPTCTFSTTGARHCGAQPSSLLASAWRIYCIGVDGTAISSGTGVERSVYDCLAKDIVNDTAYWTPLGIWHAPVFSPLSAPLEDRLKTWKAVGTFCALHFIYFGTGPAPISPFFILALLGTQHFDDLTLGHITALDPEAADKLTGWFNHPPDVAIPQIFSPAMVSISHAELPVPLIRQHMGDPAQRAECHRLVCARVLLGMSDPWSHPEFISALEGFNLELISDHLARPLVDLFLHPTGQPSGLPPGHVFDEQISALGLVDAAEARRQRDNPTLRAELFLKAATGAVFLRPGETYAIDVR
ncbi:hypothetical protein PHLGIDRAFT_123472 [Phlebiopsis gigantea 11061_1 CR5-6]|uniref:Uncharacterized protein n=1 Tax=Phlebiopsis gigantea (strain 11061_1 CR5-6) TaxID=745531 RepID=A0A0C3NA22_PHLG1|nr:hypothetical protein PHLGIDRAFT_123472 [Phlebiopsis gigantea 11061_1 CR5-6]